MCGVCVWRMEGCVCGVCVKGVEGVEGVCVVCVWRVCVEHEESAETFFFSSHGNQTSVTLGGMSWFNIRIW